MTWLARAIGGLTLWAALVSFGHAATPALGSISSTTSVVTSCVISSGPTLNLGVYAPTASAALESSGQMALTCSKGTTVSAAPLSGGAALSGGTASLSYGLYVDAAATTPWTSTNTMSAVSAGVTTPVVLTFYAKVPPGQDVAPGSYNDTVMVQVAF